MVEFVTLLSNTFRKFQLKAEIALLDREESNRQRAFGVELFDLIEGQRKEIKQRIIEDEKLKGSGSDPEKVAESVQEVLKIFQTIENEIKDPLETCRKEVEDMEASVPKFPPILIQRRKEEFGIAVWPIVSQPRWLHETLQRDLSSIQGETDKTLGDIVNKAVKVVAKGTQSTLTKAIGKLSPEEREVEACVDRAKHDMSILEVKRSEKFTEIEELISGGSTLECC